MARYFKRLSLFTFHFSLACVLAQALASCQEGGEAGDLFGLWRQEGSDTKYISFSGGIAQLKDIKVGEIFGNFQHEGDSLFMQYYSIEALSTDTMLVEQMFGFKPINNIRLKIVTLDSDNLTLSKDGQAWRFYKY